MYRSSEAIASAFYALLKYGNDPEMCLIQCVNWGGDADTIGCIVGALLGALYGRKWLLCLFSLSYNLRIPDRWFDKIENEKYGRDYIVNISKQFNKLDFH